MEEMKKNVDLLLLHGLAYESSSPWASPITMAPKKDGMLRFCIDYRRLNKVTIKDSYPMPRVEPILETHAGDLIFSKLDAVSGYWAILIRKQDQQKAAFVTPWGTVVIPLVMMFGLTNAPATYQRVSYQLTRNLKTIKPTMKTSVLLDDRIMSDKNFEDHLQNLKIILQEHRRASITLKLGKCEFFRQKVVLLGSVISRNGIAPDP